MEIIERINQLLDQKDKRAIDLCRHLGIQTSTMSTWKTRLKDPPACYMSDIASFLGVSVVYLLTGEEEKQVVLESDLTSDENELLELYRELPERKKYELIGEVKGFIKANAEMKKYLDQDKRLSS
jgi:transcriptional regulator with XRE-family HTH domain